MHSLFTERKDIKIILSFDTLEIFCFRCDIEVLDEDITRQFHTEEKAVIHIRQSILNIMQEYMMSKYCRKGVT